MVECGICIGSDVNGEYERGDFSNVEFPKARKVHHCEECRRDIKIGQVYEKYSGRWCGDFDSYKTCMDCVNIRNGLTCGNSILFGTLWEEIYYIFPHFTTACLQKVKTVTAKEYILERWREWKFK